MAPPRPSCTPSHWPARVEAYVDAEDPAFTHLALTWPSGEVTRSIHAPWEKPAIYNIIKLSGARHGVRED